MSNFSLVFLVQTMIPKWHFEINWPMGQNQVNIFVHIFWRIEWKNCHWNFPTFWMIELFVSIQFVQFSKSFVAQITNMGFQAQMCNILVFFQHPFWSKTFFTNITFVRLNMSIFNVMVKIVFHWKPFGAILTLQMHFSVHNSYGTIDTLRKQILGFLDSPLSPTWA